MKCVLQGLLKLRLLVKLLLMEMILELKITMDKVTTKKIFFWVHLQIIEQCFDF